MPVSGVIPQIRTTNLDESIAFYVTKLGLELDFKYEDFYAGIMAGGQVFHLKLVDEKDPSIDFVAAGDHLHLYFTVDDVVDRAMSYAGKGIEFLKELHDTPWGTQEFSLADNQGHVVYFGQI